MRTTQSRTPAPEPAKSPKPKLTPEQREERTFEQGQQAAAQLIRGLAVPDRRVQVAVAKILVDAGKRVSAVIAQEGIDAYDQVRWSPDDPEAAHALNLRRWFEGPDAIGAEPVDYMPTAIPA